MYSGSMIPVFTESGSGGRNAQKVGRSANAVQQEKLPNSALYIGRALNCLWRLDDDGIGGCAGQHAGRGPRRSAAGYQRGTNGGTTERQHVGVDCDGPIGGRLRRCDDRDYVRPNRHHAHRLHYSRDKWGVHPQLLTEPDPVCDDDIRRHVRRYEPCRHHIPGDWAARRVQFDCPRGPCLERPELGQPDQTHDFQRTDLRRDSPDTHAFAGTYALSDSVAGTYAFSDAVARTYAFSDSVAGTSAVSVAVARTYAVSNAFANAVAITHAISDSGGDERTDA